MYVESIPKTQLMSNKKMSYKFLHLSLITKRTKDKKYQYDKLEVFKTSNINFTNPEM